jgi:sugar phosphate isomerase/epimerase
MEIAGHQRVIPGNVEVLKAVGCQCAYPVVAAAKAGIKELLFLRESIRLTRDLGAKILRIYSCFLHPDLPRSLQWRQSVKYLREGVKYAEDNGVSWAYRIIRS